MELGDEKVFRELSAREQEAVVEMILAILGLTINKCPPSSPGQFGDIYPSDKDGFVKAESKYN